VAVHTVSVVVPVYRGETTLDALAAEIEPLLEARRSADGHLVRVSELVLVHDCGPDGSDAVIRRLAEQHEWVRPVWLSRNFGQHAATMAGMSASGGDWVATLDEDGQQDPQDIAALLDRAMVEQADVVYAAPVERPPHGPLRNLASWGAKRSMRWLAGHDNAERFNSYRLILGDLARSVAAYAGAGAYLDVALGWVARRVTSCPVRLRAELGRPSGYRWRTLMSHYWRMVVTSGTRLLRVVAFLGILLALVGFGLAVLVVVARLTGAIEVVAGWASTMVAMLVGGGAVLTALGVVAEFIGVAVNMAMGKPLYLVVDDRADGPLARRPEPAESSPETSPESSPDSKPESKPESGPDRGSQSRPRTGE